MPPPPEASYPNDITLIRNIVSPFVTSDAQQNPPVPSHSRPAIGTNTPKTKGSIKPVAVGDREYQLLVLVKAAESKAAAAVDAAASSSNHDSISACTSEGIQASPAE
ncbi:hypothetical protein K3495_g4505 [Podosphaera aphanis]|nr:hypothetical protein K3495_g4505 [Podosphaera aphanis]